MKNHNGPVLTRRQAAKMLDDIRKELALIGHELGTPCTDRDARNRYESLVRRLTEIFVAENRVPLPTVCEGEAHGNAYIDNCTMCAPHWGLVYNDTKIK